MLFQFLEGFHTSFLPLLHVLYSASLLNRELIWLVSSVIIANLVESHVAYIGHDCMHGFFLTSPCG